MRSTREPLSRSPTAASARSRPLIVPDEATVRVSDLVERELVTSDDPTYIEKENSVALYISTRTASVSDRRAMFDFPFQVTTLSR